MDNLSALSSIAAILALTTVIVGYVHGYLAGQSNFLAKIPLRIYSIAISAGLVVIAVYVTHTLTGSIAQLVAAAVIGALGGGSTTGLVATLPHSPSKSTPMAIRRSGSAPFGME